MADRIYTICSGEPEGAPVGQRASVLQVSLTLKDDGNFELVKGSYYSDWGNRSQNSSTYMGTYEERDGHIICSSGSVREIEFSSDHDWGTRELDDKTQPSSDVFTFKRINGDSVKCAVDYNGFLGGVMDTKMVPAADQYKF